MWRTAPGLALWAPAFWWRRGFAVEGTAAASPYAIAGSSSSPALRRSARVLLADREPHSVLFVFVSRERLRRNNLCTNTATAAAVSCDCCRVVVGGVRRRRRSSSSCAPASPPPRRRRRLLFNCIINQFCRFSSSVTSPASADLLSSRLSHGDSDPVCLTKPCISQEPFPAVRHLTRGFLSAVARHDISSEKMSSVVRLYKFVRFPKSVSSTVRGPAVMHVVSHHVIGTLSQIRVIFQSRRNPTLEPHRAGPREGWHVRACYVT